MSKFWGRAKAARDSLKLHIQTKVSCLYFFSNSTARRRCCSLKLTVPSRAPLISAILDWDVCLPSVTLMESSQWSCSGHAPICIIIIIKVTLIGPIARGSVLSLRCGEYVPYFFSTQAFLGFSYRAATCRSLPYLPHITNSLTIIPYGNILGLKIYFLKKYIPQLSFDQHWSCL